MKPRIIVCTTDDQAWDSLDRGCRAGGLMPERVAAMADLALLDGICVSAVVVDDHFATTLTGMSHILAKRWAVLSQAVFLTISEALTAQWIGVLGSDDDFSSGELTDWAASLRRTSPYA